MSGDIKRLFTLVWDHLMRRGTIMIAPHNHRHVYSFRIVVASLYLALIPIVAGLTFYGMFIARYIGAVRESSLLAQRQEEIRSHKAKVIAFERQIKILRESMDRLKNSDAVFRNLAGDKVKELSADVEFSSIEDKIASMSEEARAYISSFVKLREDVERRRALYLHAPALMPVKGGVIAAGFGLRRSPLTGFREFHQGISIVAPKGTPVIATGDGIVSRVAWGSKYGNYLYIDHGYGYETFYAHNDRILVRPGQRVKRGDVIAYVGSSGQTGLGNLLFYQIKYQGVPVDPLKYIIN
ncbi:MAG: M23 family metallopeptidase [bacterium]